MTSSSGSGRAGVALPVISMRKLEAMSTSGACLLDVGEGKRNTGGRGHY